MWNRLVFSFRRSGKGQVSIRKKACQYLNTYITAIHDRKSGSSRIHVKAVHY
jgi:hypothetical protein